MTEPALDLKGITAGYGDIRVLWDVSLSVWAGACTLLLGRNGAGKSTALLTASGVIRPSSGGVRFQGEDLTSMPAHRRTRAGLALVQENKRVFKRRTVEQNLVLGGYSMNKNDRRQAMEEAYSRFPILADKRKALAGSLSGGQQQMLAIAQALMPSPTVLMLDEPSAGLAPSIVKEVLHIVDRLKSEGIGILLVEQLVDKAMPVADHVVLLDHGRVTLSTPAKDIEDLSGLREAYMGHRRPETGSEPALTE
ncbi:ABC transporter ATP-binding protein [Streptosporangium sp. NBC_01755]|uniref:ABC transporter ATP-binding protein n=1 Tax=unclassified Streptosporangium TaxID=2632669 RepID=UPI002DDBBFFB|nr:MULTISPECIES: ABC transporter ATP-binding protein [unclassified Streptosporangium]WSA24608.1 ABC transporter ATP-binding protein [Streptosporangium sp. NBC_01810]WSC97316.1 ABC transporter ATP-binding protein [Streptosporangium sp. NBC_01755]